MLNQSIDQSITSERKLKKTLNDYEFINVPKKNTPDLGKGSFGQIKLIQEKDTGKKYALKIFEKSDIIKQKFSSHLKREIKIQRKLDHPHIIKLYTSFEDEKHVYLVLEYAQNGALFYYLRKKKKLAEKEAFVYFFQTCMGIDYLHKKGIIHRDLKPENLLLDEKANIKLCDFGWSTEFSGQRTTYCGTLEYMSPEQLEFKQHDYKVDIWQLGIFLYELLHGYVPFKEKSKANRVDLLQEIQKGIVYDGVTQDARTLINKILAYAPSDRPDIIDIIRHPWMKKHEKEFQMNMEAFMHKPKNNQKNTNLQEEKPRQKPNMVNHGQQLEKDLVSGPRIQMQESDKSQGVPFKPQLERKNSFNQVFNDYQPQPQPRSSSQGIRTQIQNSGSSIKQKLSFRDLFKENDDQNTIKRNSRNNSQNQIKQTFDQPVYSKIIIERMDQPADVSNTSINESIREKKSIRKGSIDKYKQELKEANNVSVNESFTVHSQQIQNIRSASYNRSSFIKDGHEQIGPTKVNTPYQISIQENNRSSSYQKSSFSKDGHEQVGPAKVNTPYQISSQAIPKQETINLTISRKKKSIFEEIKLEEPLIQIPSPIASNAYRTNKFQEIQGQNIRTEGSQGQHNRITEGSQGQHNRTEGSYKSPGKKIFDLTINSVQPTNYLHINSKPQKEFKKEFNISDLSVKERIQYFEQAQRRQESMNNVTPPPLKDVSERDSEETIQTMLGNFISDYEKQNRIQDQKINTSRKNSVTKVTVQPSPKVIENGRSSYRVTFQDRFTNRATCTQQRETQKEEMLDQSDEEKVKEERESSLNPCEKDESSFYIVNRQPIGAEGMQWATGQTNGGTQNGVYSPRPISQNSKQKQNDNNLQTINQIPINQKPQSNQDDINFMDNRRIYQPRPISQNSISPQNQKPQSKQDDINFSQYSNIIINNMQIKKQSYDPFYMDLGVGVGVPQNIKDIDEDELNYRPYLLPSQNQEYNQPTQNHDIYSSSQNAPLKPVLYGLHSLNQEYSQTSQNQDFYSSSQLQAPLKPALLQEDGWVDFNNDNNDDNYNSSQMKLPELMIRPLTFQNINQINRSNQLYNNEDEWIDKNNNRPQLQYHPQDILEQSQESSQYMNESHNSSFVSKPSKRQKNIKIHRQIQQTAPPKNPPIQSGIMDKIKFTFGCLSRPQ